MSEQEYFYSGYCFHLDAARTVGIMADDGELTECDCDYECCESRTKCNIGKEITALISPETEN